jgi:hypothetical protein
MGLEEIHELLSRHSHSFAMIKFRSIRQPRVNAFVIRQESQVGSNADLTWMSWNDTYSSGLEVDTGVR